VSIAVAFTGYEQLLAHKKEAADPRRALEDRKVVKRANGILMRLLGLDEEDAFCRLRELANNTNRRLPEIALEVIHAEEVFSLLEGHQE
jgi:response regulator NasT